ncbi:hypothetical protein AAG906_017926 [Vitis piasezkii]
MFFQNCMKECAKTTQVIEHLLIEPTHKAKATNKFLLDALKKRIQGVGRDWVKELPGVLWAHQTTRWHPIGETPFSLAYGMEVVIPTKVGMPTLRTT